MHRRVRGAVAVLAAAVGLTIAFALPAAAEPNYPPAFTRITADRTVVAPRVAVHFSAQTFTPGSTVAVDVSGSSAQSFTARVNAAGVAHAAVAFDAVGAQTVTFRGVDPLGAPLVLSTVITVVPAGSPGTGDPGTSGGGSTTGGTTVGTGSTGGGTTSATGTDGSGTGTGIATGSGPNGSHDSGTAGTGTGGTGTGATPQGAGSTGGSGHGSLSASGSAAGESGLATGGGTLVPVVTASLLAGLLLATGVVLVAVGRRRSRSTDA